MMVTAVVRKGRRRRRRRKVVLLTRKKKVMLTQDHMPSQPSTTSLPSMESEHSLGLPDDETSMDTQLHFYLHTHSGVSTLFLRTV